MAGVETLVGLESISTADHKLTFAPLVEQVVSVAGDADRKDINYTKLELALRDTWRRDYTLKLTAKPVIDWEQDGKTGAVGGAGRRSKLPARLARPAHAGMAIVGRGRAEHLRHARRAHGGPDVLTR